MRKLPYWLEEYSYADSLDILYELSRRHAERAGPFAGDLLQRIRKGDTLALCRYEVRYDTPGVTAEECYHARQASAFFQKVEELDLGVRREAVARLAFLDSEDACKATNELFRARSRNLVNFRPHQEVILTLARKKIASVLGRVPNVTELGYRFGPGATTRTRRTNASSRHKLSDGVACSEELYPLAKSLLREMPGLCEAHATSRVSGHVKEPRSREEYQDAADAYSEKTGDAFSAEDFGWKPGDGFTSYAVPVFIDDGNLHFVPKNYKTYRSIVVEPVLNGMYQLALGDEMSTRLGKFGVNLRDQSLNQQLARRGSLLGDLATLDLSGASDSISTELVRTLLPNDWFYALARGRTGHVVDHVLGRLTLEKFSSMGNGFTFPLESLLFYAICYGAVRFLMQHPGVGDSDDVVSVYGDDIIVPTWSVSLVTEVLNLCGFRLNEAKSFSAGPFRESCGRDYFRGLNIRPFYQKNLVSSRTLFALHNYYAREHRWEDAEWVRGLIHPSLFITGPDGYGDGHLLTLPGEQLALRRRLSHDKRGYGGYTFDTFTVRGRRDYSPKLPGDRVLHQYTVYRRAPEDLLDWDLVLLQAPGLTQRHTGCCEETMALPEFEDGDIVLKLVDLPNGSETDYKRISIYTFGA